MTQCPNYNAAYCVEHDYDHVLENQEQNATTRYMVWQVRRSAISVHNGKMVAEASDMAMPVGHFPQTLLVPARDGQLVPFSKLFTHINDEGEVTHVLYGSQYGDLVVYND